MTDTLFSALALSSEQLENLDRCGYKTMTEIQAKALPLVLSGKDIVAKAKTGSGKTATFALGILDKLNPKNYYIQALVLCPTRELATQVAEEIRKLARAKHNVKVLTLCGGQTIGPQIGSLEHGAHIIVGTPGRIQDHLTKRTLNISRITTLVLDEADRMLDMGFLDVVENIADSSPASRQTLLFSATYPEKIEGLASRLMRSPENVSVESQHSDEHIEQHFLEASRDSKPSILMDLLKKYQPDSTVVFCNTKQETADVAEMLEAAGASVAALHGDLDQRERDNVLVRFSQASCCVLVATDVAARGLDIDDLAMVVNYDLPRDPEIYTHRVGRTGRAGKHGKAISLYEAQERYKIDAISEYRQKSPAFLQREILANKNTFNRPKWACIEIAAGKRDKIRPGDLLGALTAQGGISGSAVGNISIRPNVSYVAVDVSLGKQALSLLINGKVKGRKVKARRA